MTKNTKVFVFEFLFFYISSNNSVHSTLVQYCVIGVRFSLKKIFFFIDQFIISALVIGITLVPYLSIIPIVVVYYLCMRHMKSQANSTRVTRNATALNGNITTGQPHPPPSTTASLSITHAPPPAYDIHETFATYNEEAPPEYYDTATQDSSVP